MDGEADQNKPPSSSNWHGAISCSVASEENIITCSGVGLNNSVRLNELRLLGVFIKAAANAACAPSRSVL